MTDIDETTREDKILEFINDIDRFLEVSYVYRGRIEEAKTAVNETSYDRHKRLTELLNSLTPKDINKPPVVEISETEAKGRTVVPDKSTLSHTQHYLKLVQKRIDSPSYASPLLDSRHIKNLLAMPPKKFIGQFGSSSFAWDVLTELASLTFLPSPQNLTARDYIHMHTVELRQHFFRIAARAKILTSEVSLELKGRFRISELYSLEKSKLIERIVEESVHREARGLVDFLIGNFIELESLFEEEYQKQQFKKVLNILCERKEQIINLMEQEERGYPDMLLDTSLDIYTAEKQCEGMVIFGLTLAYAVWFSFVIGDDSKICKGMLIKHGLFCTRSLLDEKRWSICKDVGNAIRNLTYLLQNTKWNSDDRKECHMLEANWMFAKSMCRESITDDLATWNLGQAHNRYKFLLEVLSGNFDEAKRYAEVLLDQKEASGQADLSLEEITNWPILEEFRKSENGQQLIKERE